VKEIPAPDGKVACREVEETATANAYFLPETLNVSGAVQIQKLHRGIYEAVVYRAHTVLSGKFAPPDFGPPKIDLKNVQWKDAFVTMAMNDLRGTREGIVLDWGGTKHPMLPGSQVPGYHDGRDCIAQHGPTGCQRGSIFDPLDFNGSAGIFFAPFGVQNEVTLKSNSPDPGFRGAFLPAERSVHSDAFDAKWNVSHYGRDYLQSWTSRTGNERFTKEAVSNSLSARNSSRFWTRIVMSNAPSNMVCSSSCSSYSVLFVRSDGASKNPSLPVSDDRRGALFVLPCCRLSISEFIGFSWAYLAAAVASTLLITWYCRFSSEAACAHS